MSSAQLSEVLQEIEVVRAESRSFMCAANDAEQYIRRKNVRIHGLTVKPTDDCCHVVLSLLREKLDITNVNAVDI